MLVITVARLSGTGAISLLHGVVTSKSTLWLEFIQRLPCAAPDQTLAIRLKRSPGNPNQFSLHFGSLPDGQFPKKLLLPFASAGMHATIRGK